MVFCELFVMSIFLEVDVSFERSYRGRIGALALCISKVIEMIVDVKVTIEIERAVAIVVVKVS